MFNPIADLVDLPGTIRVLGLVANVGTVMFHVSTRAAEDMGQSLLAGSQADNEELTTPVGLTVFFWNSTQGYLAGDVDLGFHDNGIYVRLRSRFLSAFAVNFRSRRTSAMLRLEMNGMSAGLPFTRTLPSILKHPWN